MSRVDDPFCLFPAEVVSRADDPAEVASRGRASPITPETEEEAFGYPLLQIGGYSEREIGIGFNRMLQLYPSMDPGATSVLGSTVPPTDTSAYPGRVASANALPEVASM